MLNEHPDIVVPAETWFIIDLMNNLPLGGVLNVNQLRVAYGLITSHQRWPDLGIDDAVLWQRLSALQSPRLADVIESIFAELLCRSGKRRWGDKTPEYIIEIERLHQVFPAAQFIHVIRDARDVCLSLHKKRWRGTRTVNAARYWSTYVSQGVAAGRRLPAGLYLEIRYEDLVRSTENKLREICTFLDLEYSDSLMSFHAVAAERIPSWERQHHTKVTRAPRLDDIERWRSEATQFQVMSIEGVAGRTMGLVGQDLQFRDWRRVMPVLFGMAEEAFWRLLRARRRIFPRT
jgi:hypothetical protein